MQYPDLDFVKLIPQLRAIWKSIERNNDLEKLARFESEDGYIVFSLEQMAQQLGQRFDFRDYTRWKAENDSEGQMGSTTSGFTI